jgi:SAM-dependent methyltransferase
MDMTTRNCCLCNHSEFIYLFAGADNRVVRCCGCDLLRLEPAATRVLTEQEVVPENEIRTEELAAQHYIRCLAEQGLAAAKILYFGLREPDVFSRLLERSGHSITYLDQATDWTAPVTELSKFDCVILYQTLERSSEPLELLRKARAVLKEAGHLIVIGLNLDSLPARIFGKRWIGWNAGLNYFFSRATLQLLFEKAGFHQLEFAADKRVYTLEHASNQISRLSDQSRRRILLPLFAVVPSFLKKKEVYLESSAMIVIARKSALLDRQKLSIIMPVYNEKNTFLEIFARVNQRVTEGIDGIDETEIIIVESNSTDGCRELVRSVQSEQVKLIFEEKPKGKGHAVRTGLKAATGEICIIQDADLEYDVYDYDALIKPLVEYRRTFILGTRHAGQWKIREFAGEALMALVFNTGHIFFTAIINVFFGQNLTDPFTMYKVFRRECIYKLKFECNRFDFDHELVIKLIKKGYQPEEIPVNYKSRGFAEGKKVTVIRDPITWIIADIKYFFASPYE